VNAKIAGLIWLAIGAIFLSYLLYIRKVEVPFSSDADLQ